MQLFQLTIILLLGAVILSRIARRLRVPYPAFLALGGAAVTMFPHAPDLVLDPQLALALFVAPVLLDAAYDTSVKDLRENWRPVGALAVMAVIVTTVAVAVVAHLLVPGMSWSAAIALGAIVAPPDAAAATAVLRQVGLPHRLLVILEGESLLNDASALLIYRAAVAAATVVGFSAVHALPGFGFVIVVSLIAGTVIGWVYMSVAVRVHDVPSSIVLQFVGTFGVWVLAERVGLSGILTVVAYGIAVARRAPTESPARVRVPSYAVWETVVFVLNVLAFLLIGLQLGPIWARLTPTQRFDYVGVAGAVLVTVIVARFAWVMGWIAVAYQVVRRQGFESIRPALPANWRNGLVISWCGMRGIVTLAAALALPDGRRGVAFPHRDLIVLCAFGVVVGTLVLQGFTLRPLLALMKLRDDGVVEREVNRARAKALRAAIDAIKDETSNEAVALRGEYEDLLRRAAQDPDGRVPERMAGDALRRRAIGAARRTAAEMRTKAEIGDDAFHRLEERLDFLDLSAGGRDEGDGAG